MWKVAGAAVKLRRINSTRMEKMQDALTKSCIDECGEDRTWLRMAQEVLQKNNINAYIFAAAVRNLL